MPYLHFQGANRWRALCQLVFIALAGVTWVYDAFWRRDVWPPTNYQIASGLATYGHKDLAADICDKTIANAIKNGISEHYDSVTGKALGVPDYCMSSTLVTMMLDGLTRKHRLSLRDKKPTDKKQSSAKIPPC